ncbi:MAG: TIGR02449 family protein [Pseudomonadota bacterium]
MGIDQNQDVNLQKLEQQLDALTEYCHRLRVENRSLKIKQGELVRERAQLIEKTTLAKTRVEGMIMRLKSMEHGA